MSSVHLVGEVYFDRFINPKTSSPSNTVISQVLCSHKWLFATTEQLFIPACSGFYQTNRAAQVAVYLVQSDRFNQSLRVHLFKIRTTRPFVWASEAHHWVSTGAYLQEICGYLIWSHDPFESRGRAPAARTSQKWYAINCHMDVYHE